MTNKVIKHIEYNNYIQEQEYTYEYQVRIKTRKLRDKKKPGKSLRTAWN